MTATAVSAFSQKVIQNPKRRYDTAKPELPWSHYYAGYSTRFALATLRDLELDPTSTVLDPWNGSGTTTSAASHLGHASLGIDINPVMNIVATARMATMSDLDVAAQRLEHLFDPKANGLLVLDGENVLLDWFNRETSIVLRQVADRIQEVVATSNRPTNGLPSPSQALLLLTLFSTARKYLETFRTSNPTWIRSAKTLSEIVSVEPSTIRLDFLRTWHVTREAVVNGLDWNASLPVPTLLTASSRSIPIPDGSIDAILTSPPYCTRIDYAVACKPELAILKSTSADGFRRLRDEMIGTPTIMADTATSIESLSPACEAILDAVRTHSAKASSTYYYRTIRQYFRGLAMSVVESLRVVKPQSDIVFVVQDSFYKELLIPLPQIVAELFKAAGAILVDRHDFPVGATMRSVNSKARVYRSKSDSIEAILHFVKQ